jgi:hypothetical protein
MHTHLFGNPAILLFRTRGFASPDYSGFARSENVLKLNHMGGSIMVSGTKKPAPKESTGLTATGSFNAGFAAPLRVAD